MTSSSLCAQNRYFRRNAGSFVQDCFRLIIRSRPVFEHPSGSLEIEYLIKNIAPISTWLVLRRVRSLTRVNGPVLFVSFNVQNNSIRRYDRTHALLSCSKPHCLWQKFKSWGEVLPSRGFGTEDDQDQAYLSSYALWASLYLVSC